MSAAAAALSSLAGIALLRLWRADLRVPFDYGGDASLLALPIKSVVDHGWYLTNPSVGAPGVLSLQDYPFAAADTLHLLIVRAMALFSHDWALLFNLYFLLGFPLIAISATAVLRHLGTGRAAAVVGGALYSCLPSRLITGEAHLFLATFFQVPLAVLAILWVCGDDPPLTRDRGPGRWPGLEVLRPRSWATLVLAAVVSSTGLYYAYFAGCLALAGGIWASVERRTLRNAVAGATLAATLLCGVAANGLPTIIHHLRHGPNAEVAIRKPAEAEAFGMKLAQLLLPVQGHRIPMLRRLEQQYRAGTPAADEGNATSLGIVGSAGFLFLLGTLLMGKRRAAGARDPLRPLAVLNIVAVLIATTGGLGSLVALLATPQIRTYARMSVVIAFFSLTAVVVLLDQVARRRPRLGAWLLSAVLLVGLFDQGTPLAARPYERVRHEFRDDADFIARVESRLPPGAIVFQLPYVSFPESVGRERMTGLDPMSAYLHGRSLRWSWPTMQGRSGDRWASDVAARPPAEMLAGLAEAGVRGIIIDRNGYADGALPLIRDLRPLLGGGDPLPSKNFRYAFYDISRYVPVAGDAPSALRRTLDLHPLAFRWANGFYGPETEAGRTFHWCAKSGEIQIDNDTDATRVLSMAMTAVAVHPPARLSISGDLLAATLALGPIPARFERVIEIPPGYHVIRFRSDGQPADVPGDPRALVWRAEGLTLREQLPP